MWNYDAGAILDIIDFDDMSSYESLKRLDVLKTGIKSVKGIGNFKKLQWLSLDYERKLEDMSEIVRLADTLRALSIENCPKITDFSLEVLKLLKSNEVIIMLFDMKIVRFAF